MTGDKELDVWDFIHILGEHRKDGGYRFFVHTLIKGINDDECLNMGSFQWANKVLPHLGIKSFLGLALKTWTNCSQKRGYWYASWNASVGNITWRLLLPSKSYEQKKLAPRLPSAKLISANFWAMVDFPVPTRPLSQKIGWSHSPFSQFSSFRRMSPLVPLRHPCLFPEQYLASSLWGILPRRLWFTSPYS